MHNFTMAELCDMSDAQLALLESDLVEELAPVLRLRAAGEPDRHGLALKLALTSWARGYACAQRSFDLSNVAAVLAATGGADD